MKVKYDYTLSKYNSPEVFNLACNVIERNFPDYKTFQIIRNGIF